MNSVSTRTNQNRNLVNDLWNDPFHHFENRLGHFFRQAIETGGNDLMGNYPVDVEEDDDAIRIEAELPGFKKDEIDVNVENGVLTIAAERQPKTEVEGKTSRHLSERRYTRVQRSFTLPRTVDGSDVDARLEDGVLHVTLNKTEESKPRRIDVK